MILQTEPVCAPFSLCRAAEITAKTVFSRRRGLLNTGILSPARWKDEIIASLKPDYIRGLTLLGGDPFEPENQKALLPFMRRVKAECPGKDVWAYTGYVLDRDLVPGGKCCTADTAELLHTIDVLVDGPFVTELHDISLLFKGSSNQRVIDCAEYCRSGEIRELM